MSSTTAPAATAASARLQVAIHPLVLVNLADQHTRASCQQRDVHRASTASTATATSSSSSSVMNNVGALLGTQQGRSVEIVTTFQLALDASSTLLDVAFLASELEQYKQVLPAYELLGWYCISQREHETHVPGERELTIHRQLLPFQENPLLLQFHASALGTTARIPIDVYESVVVEASSSTSTSASTFSTSTSAPTSTSALSFRHVPDYTIAVSDAERISVEHVLTSDSTIPAGNTSTTTATAGTSEPQPFEATSTHQQLQSHRRAITMLHARVQTLRTYLAKVERGDVAFDHGIMRRAAAVCARLEMESGDSGGGGGRGVGGDIEMGGEESTMDSEDLLLRTTATEYADTALSTYLSTVTKSLSTMQELTNKMRTCYPAESQQQLLPPGSGGMRGVGGDAGFGYRSFGGMGRRTMAGGRSGGGAGGKGGYRERGDV